MGATQSPSFIVRRDKLSGSVCDEGFRAQRVSTNMFYKSPCRCKCSRTGRDRERSGGGGGGCFKLNIKALAS